MAGPTLAPHRAHPAEPGVACRRRPDDESEVIGHPPGRSGGVIGHLKEVAEIGDEHLGPRVAASPAPLAAAEPTAKSVQHTGRERREERDRPRTTATESPYPDDPVAPDRRLGDRYRERPQAWPLTISSRTQTIPSASSGQLGEPPGVVDTMALSRAGHVHEDIEPVEI